MKSARCRIESSSASKQLSPASRALIPGLALYPVAVFAPAAKIFLAGFVQQIGACSDGPGQLNINWPTTTSRVGKYRIRPIGSIIYQTPEFSFVTDLISQALVLMADDARAAD